ncbi:hypothetical protein AB0N14_29510 [Streptomyces sp. NPDC051104]|uniref:hypothetical protein n=1 Tax=Streptomyces sp. NPDC051104 TaxID=3155044 RepID=UPI003415C3AB
MGGASGAAYTEAVTGYNTAYQPTGSTLTIPAGDGFAAAGQSTAPTSGTVTYTQSSFYTPTVGLLSTLRYQADGNLPAEDVGYGYTQQGNLDGIGGFITAANTPDYLDTAVHDPFGRVLQANYGPTGKELATFAQYDATTGRVTQTSSMLQTSATALDVTSFMHQGWSGTHTSSRRAKKRAVERHPDKRRPALPGTRHVPFPRITPAGDPSHRSTTPVHPSAGKVGHPAEAKFSITASRNVHGAANTRTRGGRRQDRQDRQRSRLGEVAVPRRRRTQIRKDSGDEGSVRKLVP